MRSADLYGRGAEGVAHYNSNATAADAHPNDLTNRLIIDRDGRGPTAPAATALRRRSSRQRRSRGTGRGRDGLRTCDESGSPGCNPLFVATCLGESRGRDEENEREGDESTSQQHDADCISLDQLSAATCYLPLATCQLIGNPRFSNSAFTSGSCPRNRR